MKFNPREWDIEPEIEYGSDDYIFGNYVDWNRFRYENEEALLESFGVELPWGKNLTFYEFISFISQDIFQNTNIFREYLEDKLLIDGTNELLYNTIIKFIERDDEISESLVSSILDYYEVPSGTSYENELPEHLRYWQPDLLDFEYNNYKKYPVKVDNYECTIQEIFNDIDLAKKELTKKALVLASLTITESMFKSIIVDKIPQDNGVSEFGKEIIQTEINKILRGNIKGKNKLFKKLYKTNPPIQKWIDLRNSLAHDIENSSIIENEIIYLNLKNDEKDKYLISDLKEDLIRYWNELKDII